MMNGEIISSACTFLQVFDDVTTEMISENTVTISKQNVFYIFLLDHLLYWIHISRIQKLQLQLLKWQM